LICRRTATAVNISCPIGVAAAVHCCQLPYKPQSIFWCYIMLSMAKFPHVQLSDFQIVRLPNCPASKLSNFQMVRLPNGPTSKLSDFQIVTIKMLLLLNKCA
jgi:hypothetical protein